MAADQRTVTVHDVKGKARKVTPEVARALEAGSYGTYSRDIDTSTQEGAIADLEAQVAELQEALDYVVAVGADQDAKIADLEKATSEPTPADDAMPEKAGDRVTWIGTDRDRAQAALDDEGTRGDDARKTVTDHARSVLDNPTPNDPAGSGQED